MCPYRDLREGSVKKLRKETSSLFSFLEKKLTKQCEVVHELVVQQ